MKPIGCEASVGLSFVSEERLDENVGVFTSEEAQTAITWVRKFAHCLRVLSPTYFRLQCHGHRVSG